MRACGQLYMYLSIARGLMHIAAPDSPVTHVRPPECACEMPRTLELTLTFLAHNSDFCQHSCYCYMYLA